MTRLTIALVSLTLSLGACGKKDGKEDENKADSKSNKVDTPDKPTSVETDSDKAALGASKNDISAADTPAATETGNVVTEEVTYQGGGVTMKGYLAYDKTRTGKRPGVLVVHEWWGHNDYARKRARMLANMGYTALAVDMYGDGKQAEHPKDAGKFVQEVIANMDAAQTRFKSAYDLLANHATTDADKMAAIGYCFGGAIVLHMARIGLELDGVASFHGSLGTQTPAQAGKVKAAVFVAHGEADPMVTSEAVAAFKKEMTDAKVDFRFESYPGAKHGFTNPGATELGKKFEIGLAYDENADKTSWAQMQQFFDKIFK